jgi:DNA-directed RNA polymerase subunit K/omega
MYAVERDDLLMKKLVDADPNEKVTTIAIREIAAEKVKLKAAKA